METDDGDTTMEIADGDTTTLTTSPGDLVSSGELWSESKCVFCRQELNDGSPKLLPCFHGACCSCVSDRETSRRNPTDLLRCTICQQEFPHVDIIDNFFIRDVSGNSKKANENVAPSCTSCEDNASATSFCTDCGEWLCDACVLAHQRVRVTKDHVIQSKSDAENARPTTVVHQSLFCPVHKQEPLKLFCESCDLLTCRDCQLTGHRDHKYQFVSEACAWQKKQIQEVISRVKEQKAHLLNANKSSQLVLDQLLDREKYIREVIKQFAMRYISEIGQRSRMLVKDLHTVCDQKKKDLSSSNENIAGVIAKMDHSLMFVEAALEQGSDLALLYSKRMLLKQLQSLQFVNCKAPPHPKDVDLRFIYDEQKLTNEIRRSGVLTVGDRVLRLPSNYHSSGGHMAAVPCPPSAVQGVPLAHGHPPPPLRSVGPEASAPSSGHISTRQEPACGIPNCSAYPGQTALQGMALQITRMVPSNQLVSSSTSQSDLQQKNAKLWDLLDKSPMSAPGYRPPGPQDQVRAGPQALHNQASGPPTQQNQAPGPHSYHDRSPRMHPQHADAQQLGSPSQGYLVRGPPHPQVQQVQLAHGAPGQIPPPPLPPPPGYPNSGNVLRDYSRKAQTNEQNITVVNTQMPNGGSIVRTPAQVHTVQQIHGAPTGTQLQRMLSDSGGGVVPPPHHRNYVMRPMQRRPPTPTGMRPAGQPSMYLNQPEAGSCPPNISLTPISGGEMHNNNNLQHLMQQQQQQLQQMQQQQRHQMIQQQQFYQQYTTANNTAHAQGNSATLTVPGNILVSSGTQKLSHYPTPRGASVESAPPGFRTVVHHTNNLPDNLPQRPQSQVGWVSGTSVIPRPPPSNTTSPAPSSIPWAPSPQSVGASHDSDCSQDSQRASHTDSNPKKDNVTSSEKSVADNVKVKSEKNDGHQDVDITNRVLESMDKLLATLRTDASQEAAALLNELTNDGVENAQKQKPDSSSSPVDENGKKSTSAEMDTDESPEVMPATPPPPKIPVVVTLDDDGTEHVDEARKEESVTVETENANESEKDKAAEGNGGDESGGQQAPETAANTATVIEDQMSSALSEDPNEDWCAVCHDGGDLLCCGNCPRVYHLECHVPPLPSVPKEEDNWHCLMCTNLLAVQDDDDVDGKRKADSGLDGKELRLCQRILLEVFCHEASPPFHEPVSTVDVPNYNKVISQPMDLETVKCKLAPDYYDHYSSVDEFLHDMYLIFTNCCSFNDKKSDLHIAGKTLGGFLHELVAKFLPNYAKGNSGDSSKQRIKRKKTGEKTPALHIW